MKNALPRTDSIRVTPFVKVIFLICIFSLCSCYTVYWEGVDQRENKGNNGAVFVVLSRNRERCGLSFKVYDKNGNIIAQKFMKVNFSKPEEETTRTDVHIDKFTESNMIITYKENGINKKHIWKWNNANS